MRYCLNVHGVMLCDGPQHHEGGCTFTQGWQLARKLEDELASIAGYAGDTTNELRETRERVEAAEARCARLQQALTQISETANWYAKNDGRLQHEVDHCLCVEIPSIADEALAASNEVAANGQASPEPGPDTPFRLGGTPTVAQLAGEPDTPADDEPCSCCDDAA